MSYIAIREVSLDPSAGVRITPDLPRGDDYDAVYRGVMSVRWDDSAFTLHMVPRPDRTPAEAFRRIVGEVAKEYGDQLVLTPSTQWRDVPPADQAAILASASATAR